MGSSPQGGSESPLGGRDRVWRGRLQGQKAVNRASGVVVQVCDYSTPETQTGGSGVPGQPEVHSETVSTALSPKICGCIFKTPTWHCLTAFFTATVPESLADW